jgi:hypothetical protein
LGFSGGFFLPLLGFTVWQVQYVWSLKTTF